MKQQVLSQIDSAEKSRSADDKKLAEIQTQMANYKGTLQKIRMLVGYANQFGSSDRNTALKLLKQASEMADTMKPGKDQTDAQIQLAMTYCLQKAIMDSPSWSR